MDQDRRRESRNAGLETEDRSQPVPCPFGAEELRALYGTQEHPGPAPSLLWMGHWRP
jgi:hypothetical protein